MADHPFTNNGACSGVCKVCDESVQRHSHVLLEDGSVVKIKRISLDDICLITARKTREFLAAMTVVLLLASGMGWAQDNNWQCAQGSKCEIAFPMLPPRVTSLHATATAECDSEYKIDSYEVRRANGVTLVSFWIPDEAPICEYTIVGTFYWEDNDYEQDIQTPPTFEVIAHL